MSEHRSRSRLVAVLRQRCPRCREGRVYRGIVDMERACPACGLVYEREHGYFTGAMAVSYGLAVPVLVAATLLVGRLTGWPIEWAMLGGDVLFILLVPLVFRYSRVVWMHFDRLVDPYGIEPD